MKPPFHADHVGSLIRPRSLIEARKANLEGKLPASALAPLEDQAVDDMIAMQERVGIEAITDGEARRNNWRDRFFERVDGFSADRIPSTFIFTSDDGVQSRGMPIPVVTGKLKRRETLTTDDFKYVKRRTKKTAKATLPSPAANHFFSGDASLKNSPYRSRAEFFDDVSAIYRQEIADLHAAGCTYLQIDEVPIAVLCDPKNGDRVRARGEDPDQLVDDYIKAINDSVRDKPAGMTVCVHLCRGNNGKGQGSGGYDSVAERLFQQTNCDGFFLEYDTERAGDFTPLRHLPKNKHAILGVISTKIRDLEPVDEVRKRIDAAGKYAPVEQLGISPQCGFASSYMVDRFTSDDEERKLAHVVEIARRIWG
ncbi:MAG TPA: 5-methyltetrahydropteroyltriglutamate--homocysteine S-methyltransferase [Xanthobacteraceae bacterium]|nr:5-methyltetrahydropteroyltriglutamate--homocysteine S-methyltransferase [Xanthobacteraceae bacterium]